MAQPTKFKCRVKGCEEWLPFEEGITCKCGQLYHQGELGKITKEFEVYEKHFKGWTEEDFQRTYAPNFHYFRIMGLVTLLGTVGWAIFSYLASQPH